MISSKTQINLMGLVVLVFLFLYAIPFERNLLLIASVITLLFPTQLLLWRVAYGRKLKDFFIALTLMMVNLLLKHYWTHSDIVFYLTSIILAAVVRYPVFLGITATALGIEALRENYYGQDKPYEILIRYILFLVAGSLTFFLLRDEKKQKERFRRKLEDLTFSIHQFDKNPGTMLSDSGETSRKIDAAETLDESLKNTLLLVHSIFKPNAVLLWQYLGRKKQLRLRKYAGHIEHLKENLNVPLGEGPVGWTGLNRKVFLQQDKEEGIKSYAYKKNFPIRSLLAVPVIDGDKLEGVISLDSDHLNHFGPETEKAVLSFAAQIAEMIRMARLAKEREDRAFEFQAFYNASKELSSMIDFEEIVQKLHGLTSEIAPADFTAIAISHPNNTYAVYQWKPDVPAPVVINDLPNDGKTWISWFLRHGEEPLILSASQLKLQEMPLVLPDDEIDEYETFLALPMRHQQNVIGAFLLASHNNEAFTSDQSRILSILCNQATVSLENSSIIKKMEELAITDGLTGLYNHRHFQESFEHELERAQRLNQPLTLLLLDIDHFKGFNDSFGHPAGDFILKNLASLLKGSARKIDLLARYGGEEFAGLLPGIDLKNARKTAERWRKAIQRASFKWEGKTFAVTVSIGYATSPADGTAKAELIERADRALYDAKENGRNQVRHWGDAGDKKSRVFG